MLTNPPFSNFIFPPSTVHIGGKILSYFTPQLLRIYPVSMISSWFLFLMFSIDLDINHDIDDDVDDDVDLEVNNYIPIH